MSTAQDWLIAGAGFLIGMVLLGLITSLVVLIDIKVQLTQTSTRRGRTRRGRDDADNDIPGV